MNIKRAKEEIKNCIEAYLLKDEYGEYAIPSMRQRPLFLIGPPGIGKTQIMEQVARENQVGLVAYTITHHTRQSAIGLPFIERKNYGGQEYAVTEYTMSEIVASVYDYMEKTGVKEGLLFIDEINCVSETLAPTMLQFLQYKTFGNHKVPEGWIIVTAGNPPEYNKSVREFDIATLDRVKRIDVEADFSVWKEYAVLHGVHPAVLSYLDARKEHFYRVETTVDGKWFATPRGWEDLSYFLSIYEKQGKIVDRDVIYQYIEHAKIAKDFASYLELYHKYQSDYQIEKILAGERNEALIGRLSKASFDEKFSVLSLILAGLTEGFRTIYFREMYLERLLEQLQQVKAVRDGASVIEKTLSDCLKDLAKAMETELIEQKKAGLVGRAEEHTVRDTADCLLEYRQKLLQASDTVWESGFACITGFFEAETEAFETACDTQLLALENVFCFLEAAFGDSQEMVIFVTELNTNYYSVSFLKENRCEQYYEYNKRLLFESREDDIRQRLRKL